ncbi:MAG: c-type cytochrome biogenesis protein CcsB [Gammaproteobacteria bacterium]|nr:c-type cytochrome biogenesis protein CcsB [Gammaproteobacteria bacterium]
MNDTIPATPSRLAPPGGVWGYWLGLLILTLGLAGLAITAEADRLIPGMPFDQLLSYKLTGYANVLLAAATLVYLAHLWFTAPAVGKWASGLATAGGVGLLVALLTLWFETHQVLEEGHVPISNLYEVTIFFTALTTLIYLILESYSRNRHAGAFVMPIVVAGIGFELWLVSQGSAGPQNLVPALKSYWMHAHVLANFIGYGAFAVACGGGVMYLVRHRAEAQGRTAGVAIRVLPGLDETDTLMYRAIAIGFVTFTIATILGAAWAYDAWGGYWSWDPKETWSLIVWITYAIYLHLRFVKGWAGTRMAWWAILGFAVTLFCFLGVNMFLSGLHSYGQIG